MKILFVNNDKGWGGGQEFLLNLACALMAKGHCPHVICREGSPSERTFRERGISVHSFSRRGVTACLAPAGMARLFRREMFDIVAVSREHDLLMSAAAWRLAFPFGSSGRFVACYHTATSRRQLLAGTADAVICVSAFVRDQLLVKNGSLAPKTILIPNGIPLAGVPAVDKFDPQRGRRFFTGVGFPLIGMVGAFFKNQEELLQVASLLCTEFPGLTLALVGDTADIAVTGRLREMARQLGLSEHVIFTGKVPHDRMGDIFYDLDLSVSTFRREGFGLVHLESLAAGTPAVAYNEGGQADFLREAGGVLVEGGATEFARETASLLRDHERLFAMGMDGYRLVAGSYSLEKMADAYESLFISLLAQGGM